MKGEIEYEKIIYEDKVIQFLAIFIGFFYGNGLCVITGNWRKRDIQTAAETTQALSTEAATDEAGLAIKVETITVLPDHGLVTDWVDASQVIIIKENTTLDKLETLSESYPMSIYSYDVERAAIHL